MRMLHHLGLGQVRYSALCSCASVATVGRHPVPSRRGALLVMGAFFWQPPLTSLVADQPASPPQRFRFSVHSLQAKATGTATGVGAEMDQLQLRKYEGQEGVIHVMMCAGAG